MKKEYKYITAYKKVRDVIMSCNSKEQLKVAFEMYKNYGRVCVEPFGWINIAAYKREKILADLLKWKLEKIKETESINPISIPAMNFAMCCE